MKDINNNVSHLLNVSWSNINPLFWWRDVRNFFSIPSNRPHFSVYVLFFTVVGMTLGVDIYLDLHNREKYLQNFQQDVSKLKMNLAERNARYHNLLISLSALFDSHNNLNYEQWLMFVSRIINTTIYPGILGASYIEKVSPEKLRYFKDQMQQQFHKNLVVIKGESLWDGSYAFIKYSGNLAFHQAMGRDVTKIIGFNVSSKPESKIALEWASKHDNIAVTSLTYLKDDEELKRPAVIAYYPVYYPKQDENLQDTSDAQVNRIKGWVAAPIEVKRYMDGVIPSSMYAVVFDGNDSIYTSHPEIKNTHYVQEFSIMLGGREWHVRLGSLVPLQDESQGLLALIVPIVGLILAFMSSIFIWSLTTTRRRALEIARSMSEDLRVNEFKTRTMIDNIPGAIYRCKVGINWQMEFINDAIEEITGYQASDFMTQQRCLSDLIHEQDIETIESTVGVLPKPDHSYYVEYRLFHKDGSVRWVYERGQVVLDKEKKGYFLTGALFDITERKKNERDLRKLTSAMQNAVEGIAFINMDLRFVTLNQAVASMVGSQSLQAVLGHHILDFIHSSQQRDVVLTLKNMRGLEKQNLSIKALRLDETEFHMQMVVVSAFDDEDGFQEGYFCFIRDITDDIQEEEKLAKAVEAAHFANQTKSEFLATMSHELRTPLNAIIGYSEMLMEEAEEDHLNSVGDLKKINHAGRHLLDLINDILDVSKLEAGKTTIYLEKFDVPSMINYVKDIISPNIQKNNNKFHLEFPENIGEMYSDFMKLKQGILNLLSNAAKFTENGTISLIIEETKIRNREFIRFSVKDTGCGITPEQIEKLFKPFTQADSSTTRKYGGTGLGLTITKQFIEMLGGLVHVESKAGLGSTFSITLPRISRAPRGDEGSQTEHPLSA